jgi:eukaryotic-like serine/threonine-protein kinase
MDLVREGDVLAGKYRIERVLGQGGMGVVVAAQHVQLAQRVALKFLLPEACSHGEAVARFLREARAAVQIQSEHVARVSDVGQLDNGAPYMVMEFLHGSDLGATLAARGPLPVLEAVDYVLQAMEAVAEAHSIGIVHRDLKPANLFLTRRRDGSALVKVLDFGISKATQGEAGLSLTSTSAVMGSPFYMSPEQVRSAKDVDARADIWALGVILHELLAGAPPFSADTASALFAAIIADPPAPVRERRPDVPAALEAVLARCFEKDRNRRYANVAELAAALEPFAPASSAMSVMRVSRVLGVTAVHAAPVTIASPSVQDATASGAAPAATAGAWGNTRSGRKRSHAGLYVVLSIGALALLGGGATLALRGKQPTPEAQGSASASLAATPVEPPGAASAPAPPPVVVAAEPLAPPEPPASAAPVTEKRAPVATSRATSKPAARATTTTKPPGATPASRRQKDLFDDTQ